jgi:hypothetical protein
MLKYQAEFAAELTEKWLAGNHEQVKMTIRQLKNKAQAAYIAARVTLNLTTEANEQAKSFVEYIHPNQ